MLVEASGLSLENMQTYNPAAIDRVEGPLEEGRRGSLQKTGRAFH